MAKVMSLLEKYNLVEKVNKGDKTNKENTIIKEETSSKKESNTKVINEEIKEEIKEIEKENVNKSKEKVEVSEKVVKENLPRENVKLEYENKMMIKDIYSLFDIENSEVNTIFMLQNLINALPQNLPQDVVKQSVMGIIDASNINLKELLSDGKKRLEILDKVMNEYNKYTSKSISDYKEEIRRLSNLIKDYEGKIKMKEEMLEDQN